VTALVLARSFLLPMDSGGKIRTGKLLEQLRGRLDITLVSSMDIRKDAPALAEIRALCTSFRPVPRKGVRRGSWRFYARVAPRLFSRYPVAVAGAYSRRLERTVHEALRAQPHDLVICESLHPSLNLWRVRGHPTVLVQPNVETVLAERRLAVECHASARLFGRSQARKLDRFEREACGRFSAVIAYSEVDRDILKNRFGARHAYAIPTGVDVAYFAPRPGPVEGDSLLYVGSMDWAPNEDAVLFFVREILGRVRRELPSVRLTVVGRKPSRRLLGELRAHPEVTVTGAVPDVRPHLARHTVCVLPLRAGSGTRTKVYEAMAMGKVVVSTRIGVEGLPVRDGEHVRLADTPEDFARVTLSVLRDASERTRVERSARQFVEQNFGWDRVADVFEGICHEVVRESRAAGSAVPGIGVDARG
jgi:glycosyltransferase involved in cell wall biosynthesis